MRQALLTSRVLSAVHLQSCLVSSAGGTSGNSGIKLLLQLLSQAGGFLLAGLAASALLFRILFFHTPFSTPPLACFWLSVALPSLEMGLSTLVAALSFWESNPSFSYANLVLQPRLCSWNQLKNVLSILPLAQLHHFELCRPGHVLLQPEF